MPLARPKRQTRPAPYMLLLALARAWLARLRVCAGWLLPVCKQFMGWQLLFVCIVSPQARSFAASGCDAAPCDQVSSARAMEDAADYKFACMPMGCSLQVGCRCQLLTEG